MEISTVLRNPLYQTSMHFQILVEFSYLCNLGKPVKKLIENAWCVQEKLYRDTLKQVKDRTHLRHLIQLEPTFIRFCRSQYNYSLWLKINQFFDESCASAIEGFGYRVYIIQNTWWFIWEVKTVLLHVNGCTGVCTNRTIVTSQMNDHMIWIGWQQGCKHLSRIRLLWATLSYCSRLGTNTTLRVTNMAFWSSVYNVLGKSETKTLWTVSNDVYCSLLTMSL